MSGSAARALAATGARLPVVAIGPQTAAEARAAGLDVVAVADHSRPRRPRRGITFLLVVITFLTDFGLQDDFVGTCHGVIATSRPTPA